MYESVPMPPVCNAVLVEMHGFFSSGRVHPHKHVHAKCIYSCVRMSGLIQVPKVWDAGLVEMHCFS